MEITPRNRDILIPDYFVNYRDNLRSKVWNEMNQGVIDSSNTIFAWQNYLYNRQNKYNEYSIYESQMLAYRILADNATFLALSGYLVENQYGNYPYFYTNFILSDCVQELNSTEVAEGTLHLDPVSFESKVDLIPNFFGDNEPSQNTTITYNVGMDWQEDSNLKYVCDGNLGTSWIYLEDEDTPVMIQIENLTGMESPYINTISITPAPDFAFDLTNVEIRNSMETYSTIPGFSTVSLIGGARTYYMDDTYYNNIFRLTMLPKISVVPFGESSGTPKFIVGIKDIKIGRTEFSREGYAIIHFTAKQYVRYIKALYITSSTTDYNLLRVRLYTDINGSPFYDNTKDPFPLTETDSEILVPAFVKEIYVKLDLFYLGTTPTISDIFISYIPGDV